MKRRPGKKKLEKQRKLLRQEIESFKKQHLVWPLKKLQQKRFESANKSGKYLAQQLKRRKENRLINKITEDQKEITEESKIKEAFLKYYSNL